jgi:hypothetical protein
MTELQEGLIRATAAAVRPFVARLLALGVPFGWVERRVRELFVEVAEAEVARPDRRATDSRITVLTGINRKEVRRIRSAGPRSRDRGTFSMNHVTSLVGRWMTDPATTDRAGRPRVIPYRAKRGPSFMKLAQHVTTDLAPGVLLEQLVASGAAEVRDGNMVALRTPAYVPRAGSAEQLQILAEDPAELIETILRNALAEGGERLLQRKVYYDNLGSDAAARIRAQMRREGQRFLGRVNRLLARYDRDRNPKAARGARHYAGVGVYFFEATEASPRSRSPRRRNRKHEEQD